MADEIAETMMVETTYVFEKPAIRPEAFLRYDVMDKLYAHTGIDPSLKLNAGRLLARQLGQSQLPKLAMATPPAEEDEKSTVETICDYLTTGSSYKLERTISPQKKDLIELAR